jgi:hypothetical protein
MKNGVVNGGKKGKSQGIEGSANVNDVWLWMRSHIRFYTIEKYDLLSFFSLIESLPAACKFHPLFFVTRNSSYEVSPLLLFNHYSLLFFLGSFFLLGRDSLIGIFRRITW